MSRMRARMRARMRQSLSGSHYLESKTDLVSQELDLGDGVRRRPVVWRNKACIIALPSDSEFGKKTIRESYISKVMNMRKSSFRSQLGKATISDSVLHGIENSAGTSISKKNR